MSKVLVIDDPDRPDWGTTTAPYEPYNRELDRKKWDFDSADIALLEEDKTLFRGDVAFWIGDDYEE